jgi:hypothetical protein
MLTVGTLQNTTITLLCVAKSNNAHEQPIHLIVRITPVAQHIVAAAIDATII